MNHNDHTSIDVEAFKIAVSKDHDGFIFENFAKSFLSNILGYDFVPVGGTKDKGLDGFRHLFHRETREKDIYQISTEQTAKAKIDGTMVSLKKNKKDFDRLYYVTNRKINNKDVIQDSFYEKNKKPLVIYDIDWFANNVVSSISNIRLYYTFIESNLHEFNKPGKEVVVGHLDRDARLYVFLSNQLETYKGKLELEEILVDSLILYTLEGTSSEKGIFKTSEEIFLAISKYFNFEPEKLLIIANQRLQVLATKPRKIKYHSDGQKYCLPYKTRLKLLEKEIKDKEIHRKFIEQSEEKIKSYLKDGNIRIKDIVRLVEETIHCIYYKQGLEFSDFILNNKSTDMVESSLPDIIAKVVDESQVVFTNKEKVKPIMLMAFRDMIYNGTDEQKLFLCKLSNTYMMMFLLQWDPSLILYFKTLASKLNIYVGTSILIPAFSEFYLEKQNKRHWNLLTGAHNSGVRLIVNEIIISELVNHFRYIIERYKTMFKDCEEYYIEDELRTLYVDEILIRAYLYAKARKKVKNFEDYIELFIDLDMDTPENDLIQFLKDEFGIEYIATKDLEINIDENEYKSLVSELSHSKKSKNTAKKDARLMLTIYNVREKQNETSKTGIFGYNTWWLSKDTQTHQAIKKVFNEQYKVNCYMRTDFLYKYISLAPSKNEIDDMFKSIFPSILGIKLSYHMPSKVCEYVNSKIKEHCHKNPSQMKRSMRKLSNKMMTDKTYNYREMRTYFEDELEKQIKQ